MKFSEALVRKAAKCCADFYCGECPYTKYDDNDFKLRCIHMLVEDLNELVNGKEENNV